MRNQRDKQPELITWPELESLAMLKAHLLTDGVRLAPTIEAGELQHPFYSIVTQGVELEINNNVTVNAKLNNFSKVLLRRIEDKHEICFNGNRFAVKILPVSKILTELIPGTTKYVSDYCYIATDRINIWAVENCAMAVNGTACKFCDVAFDSIPYERQNLENIRYSVDSLKNDSEVPARHIQVSGGTPLNEDWDHFLSVCEIAIQTGLPVSVMTTPWTPFSVIDSLQSMGVIELAVNIEFASEATRKSLTPGKLDGGWERLARIAQQWPEKSVRSALIAGPEAEETTIEGVTRMLDVGIVPMLSPFRPAPGTPMSGYACPSPDNLFQTYIKALEIAAEYKSFIGPSCRYCQHNVMALPLK